MVDLTFGIPVYNGEKYISELLNCFEETNCFTYEVIIVDDGSVDNTYNICNSIKNKHFRVFHKENGGVSSARNYIIDKSNGKFITFIDADDLIDFNKYSKIFINLLNSAYDLGFGIRNKRYYNKYVTNLDYLIEHELINSPIDKFYLKSIINDNNIRFDCQFSLGEDLLFNLNYYKCAKSIYYYYSDNMYVIRRVNDNSLTSIYRDNKFEELMSVNNECIELFGNDKQVLKSLEYIRVKNCISCIKDIYLFPGKISNVKEYINIIKKNKKVQFLFLNNLHTTLVYYFWYFVPNNFKLFLISNKYSK